MKKKILPIISSAFILALVSGSMFSLHGSKKAMEARADSIVLNDTTDCADGDHYGFRTKSVEVGPEKAYGNTDQYTATSPVYTDQQYSSNKSLQLKDKGKTSANSPIAMLNPFGSNDELKAGSFTWADVKTKKIEFLINFETEKVDLNCSLLDLDTSSLRATSHLSIQPVYSEPFISFTDSSEWYVYVVDMSLFSLETGKSDATKIGGLRLQTLQATTTNFYIDQLRMVDSQIFDPEKAHEKPFDDVISMYEDDDLARQENFYGGKYSYTTITDDTYSEQSTKALKILATADNSAHSNFFFDVWDDGIYLSELGSQVKLVGYIKGSLTNTSWLAHATRFTFTFSTSDHQKATGNVTATFYFEHLIDTKNGWYYMEFDLASLVDAVDESTYPLDSTKVYGLRMSCGDYVVAKDDYYVFDALMVVDYKAVHDLISDVSAVETCSTNAETVSGYKERYLALNGYDRNTFDTFEVVESGKTITLGYKLDYMIGYYGVNGLSNSNRYSTVDSSFPLTIVVIIAVASITAVGMLLVIKKRKNNI